MRWTSILLLSLFLATACGGPRPGSPSLQSKNPSEKSFSESLFSGPDYLSLPRGLTPLDSNNNPVKLPEGVSLSNPADDLKGYNPDFTGEPSGLVNATPVDLTGMSGAFVALKDAEKYRKVAVNIFPNNTTADLKRYPGREKIDPRKFRLESNGDLIQVSSPAKGVIATGKVVEVDLSKRLALTIDDKSYEFDQSFFDITKVGAFRPERPWIKACWQESKARSFKGFCRRYRGSFAFVKKSYRSKQSYGGSDFVNVINIVYLDDYLKGVVPAEIGTNAPDQALVAQILAARTYALYQMIYARETGFGKEHGYDLEPTELNQVYLGYDNENRDISAKIDGTRGQVIMYQGKLILAEFHSDSFGLTCSANGLPYLKSVSDPVDTRLDGRYREVTTRKTSRLISVLSKLGIPFKGLARFIEPQRDSEGHISAVLVGGDQGTVTVPQGQVAAFHNGLEIKDNYERADIHGDNIVVVTYKHGHCRGLSQMGAIRMAQSGKTAEEIIKNYYNGVSVARLKEL